MNTMKKTGCSPRIGNRIGPLLVSIIKHLWEYYNWGYYSPYFWHFMSEKSNQVGATTSAHIKMGIKEVFDDNLLITWSSATWEITDGCA